MNYWLLKSDPESYSIDKLKADKQTIWDGVRNYQARNYLALMKKGDQILIYHSGSDKAIVGAAIVSKESFPDPSSQAEGWLAIEIKFKSKFNQSLNLEQMRGMSGLSEMLLFRQSRLSVMPLLQSEYEAILSSLSK